MKAMIASVVAATGLMIAGGVMAADMPDLAKKYGCANCHSIDKRAVGQNGRMSQISTKVMLARRPIWPQRSSMVAAVYGELYPCLTTRKSATRKLTN